MDRPKPKRVYWRAVAEGAAIEFAERVELAAAMVRLKQRRRQDPYAGTTCDPLQAEQWRRNGWPLVTVKVYSARELREWERQREGEIRREERLRIAAWLFAEGYCAAASEIRRWL